MGRFIILNKPFRVLCQFSRDGEKKTLADYVSVPGVYPVGRLDYESEGLVLLTDDGQLQHRLTDPRFGHTRSYWVQVEGALTLTAIQQLEQGVMIEKQQTSPSQAALMEEPSFPERDPPIRFRKSISTSWLSLTLREGRNRQVRHMTAAVGFPTLRLIRFAIGDLTLRGLAPGEWRALSAAETAALRKRSAAG